MTSTQIAPQTQNGDRAGERVWRTELSPVSFLRRAAEVHADATALVHGARRWSYRELNERVTRLTSALRGLGVDHGDRVAVLAPNTPAMVEAHFAVPAAGALLVCINIRQSPGEVARLLEHAEPRVILVDAEFEGLLSSFDSSSAEVIRIADTGSARRPLRAARGVRLSRAAPGRAARRGGRHRDQLHVGHDRRPEGRDLHAPRGLPERPRQRDRGAA